MELLAGLAMVIASALSLLFAVKGIRLKIDNDRIEDAILKL